MANLMWDLATTGKAVFPDGRELEVSPQDWFGIAKFLYGQIDGPPKPVSKDDFSDLTDDELIAALAEFARRSGSEAFAGSSGTAASTETAL
jgi:hypothetical protein